MIMPKRNVDTALWGKPWFEAWPFEVRGLYIFLETMETTKPCGIFTITLERISRETAWPVSRIQKAIELMGDAVMYDPDKSLMFIRRFVKHQRNSQKWLISVERSLNELAPHKFIDTFLLEYQCFNIAYVKPTDRLSIATDTDNDSNVLGLKGGMQGGEPSGLIEAFDLFYAAYPNQKAPAVAKVAWLALAPGPALIIKIMAGLEAAKKSLDWTYPSGQLKPEFIQHPDKWLSARAWEGTYLPRPVPTPGIVSKAAGPAPTEADINYTAYEQALNNQ